MLLRGEVIEHENHKDYQVDYLYATILRVDFTPFFAISTKRNITILICGEAAKNRSSA